MRMYDLEDGRKQLKRYNRFSNTIPKVCLGYKSPNEIFAEYQKKAVWATQNLRKRWINPHAHLDGKSSATFRCEKFEIHKVFRHFSPSIGAWFARQSVRVDFISVSLRKNSSPTAPSSFSNSHRCSYILFFREKCHPSLTTLQGRCCPMNIVGLSMMCYAFEEADKKSFGEFQLSGRIGKALCWRRLMASCFLKSSKK